MVQYRAGGKWWPDGAFEAKHIRPEQEARYESDAWEEAIEEFLKPLARVRVSEIAKNALHIDTPKIGTSDIRRITAVLYRLGWTSIRDWKGPAYVKAKQQ